MLGFPEVFGGPGRFKKVREAGIKDCLLLSSTYDLMVSSDNRKQQLTIKKRRLFQCEHTNAQRQFSLDFASWVVYSWSCF